MRTAKLAMLIRGCGPILDGWHARKAGAASGAPTTETVRSRIALVGVVVGLLARDGGEAGDAAPGAGLPVVGDFLGEDPRRELHSEELRKGFEVGLVHAAELRELLVRGFRIGELEAGLAQARAQALKFGRRQAVDGSGARGCVEKLRQIDDGVAADGERQTRLAGAGVFDACNAAARMCRE